MARELHAFHVTIPAGTPVASPQITALALPQRVVREVHVLVPPGPRGEVGWQLGSSGVAVLPIESGTFIVTDDEIIRWPLEGLWDSGGWQMFAYNTGHFTHTLEVRFLCDLTQGQQQQAQAGPVPLSVSSPVELTAPPPPNLPPLPLPPTVPLPPPPQLPPPPSLPGPPSQAQGGPWPRSWNQSQEKEMVIFEFAGQLHLVQIDPQGNMQHSLYSGGWRNEVIMTGLQPRGHVAYDIGYNQQLHFVGETPEGRFKHRWYANNVWSDPEVV